MEQLTKVVNGNTYRIKQLSAIEALALRATYGIDSVPKAQSFFDSVLERIEVQCGTEWYSVKEGQNFLPTGIENDIETIETLISFFLNDYFRPLFHKSNKSN